MPTDEQTPGASLTQPVRVGDTVIRNAGPWSPAVHELLLRLKEKGFSHSPRPLGFQPDGKEILSYLPGEGMHRPWGKVLTEGDGLVQITGLVKEVHDLTADWELPESTIWRSGPAAKKAGQIMRHGDLGPWNSLWQGDMLTGLIDWDFAEPGERLTDIAQLAWYFIPLAGDQAWQPAGFSTDPDPESRLETICLTYGSFTAADVIRELDKLQKKEIERTKSLGDKNLYPWSKWLKSGDIAKYQAENQWLRTTFAAVF